MTNTIARLLGSMYEYEVDSVLRSVGCFATDSGWGEQPEVLRRVAVATLLGEASNDQLAYLLAALEPTDGPARATSVASSPSPQSTSILDEGGPIFVVHGRDHERLHYAVRVLESSTGRVVTVLHEQASTGRSVLEKFEDHAAKAAYAVVLLTADDEGGLAGGTARPRGRQNVIFELGYFFGKLGRRRVAVLLAPGVEEPSDINGLVYIPLDPGGGWKQALGRELASVGIDVDYSRMP